jgi:hypothetical protein
MVYPWRSAGHLAPFLVVIHADSRLRPKQPLLSFIDVSSHHRYSTYIRLGPVEAYAASHRRVMAVLDTGILLSLHSEDPRNPPDALRALREGDKIEPLDLEYIIPGIAFTLCQFTPATAELPYHTTTTISDGVVTVLSLEREMQHDCAAAEAQLRGTQARLVVTMLYSRV